MSIELDKYELKQHDLINLVILTEKNQIVLMVQTTDQKEISDQAGAASDSPSSGNLTTSKSSDVMSPF
jgi:hypothetical protein